MNGVAGQGYLSYLNLEHGLRMDYPASWIVKEQSSPASYAVAFGSPQESSADQFQENLTIVVQPVFEGTTLDALQQSWSQMAKQAPIQIAEAGLATLCAQPAFRVVFETPLGNGQISGKVMMYLLLIGTRGYTVTYTGQNGHLEVFLPDVTQMLSTLQIR